MNKALFLDRDGIVNVDHGYTYKIDQFEFVDGIFSLCEKAQSKGYLIVIVTNQSGIARGYYSESDVNALHSWVVGEFSKRNIKINGVYFCPHHPEKGQSPYVMTCNCRKPAPGMLLDAAKELEIDLTKSIMVGDKESDVLAAKNAGVEKRFLVSSQYHKNLSILSIHVNNLNEIISQID